MVVGQEEAAGRTSSMLRAGGLGGPDVDRSTQRESRLLSLGQLQITRARRSGEFLTQISASLGRGKCFVRNCLRKAHFELDSHGGRDGHEEPRNGDGRPISGYQRLDTESNGRRKEGGKKDPDRAPPGSTIWPASGHMTRRSLCVGHAKHLSGEKGDQGKRGRWEDGRTSSPEGVPDASINSIRWT